VETGNEVWQALRREAKERLKAAVEEENRISYELVAAIQAANDMFMEISVG
jgi:hypothetical protein